MPPMIWPGTAWSRFPDSSFTTVLHGQFSHGYSLTILQKTLMNNGLPMCSNLPWAALTHINGDLKPKEKLTIELKKVKLIYFSATGTTQKVLESIAKGTTVEDVEHINLTLPEGAQQTIPPFSDELVMIGAPVYGGRLPVDAINRLKQLKASKTLAVLIIVYGNRDFDDALLELKNLAIELGFNPVSGGASLTAVTSIVWV